MRKLHTILLVLTFTIIKAQVPTASFSIPNNSVCPLVPMPITNLSTGGATSYTYVINGNYSVSPITPAVTFTNDGINYIELYAQNSSGISAPYGQTVMVYPNPVVATGSVGSVNLFPPDGSTNGWSPLVYNFNDPLPPNSVLAGITITFTGVDQGWGGTGDPAIFYLAGKQVGYGIFLHTANNYTITKMAPFPNYVYGGSNNLEMYFTGYPGWQGFFTNGLVTLYYHTVLTPTTICSGTPFTLSGIGASSYTWSPAAPNGVAFTPTASAIYTVTGTSSVGCTGTRTQQVNVAPSPTIYAASGAICQGQSFVITPLGAGSFTISGGNYTVSPSSTTSYSISGSNPTGCTSASPAIVTVTVVPLPVLSVNSGTACVGSTFTLQPSGAATYTIQGGSPVITVSASTNYSITGSNSLGCQALLPAIASITAVQLPQVSVPGATICSGNSFTLQPSGAQTYSYSSGSAVVSPTTGTTYTVTGSNAQGCTAQASVRIEVGQCMGIASRNISGFEWYPQPSSGLLTINSARQASFVICDATGRVVNSGVLQEGDQQLDLTALDAGLYLIRVSDGFTGRIILVE